MLTNLILFLTGVIILYIGGELFIRGSSNTARIFGIKPLVVGVVIVAFATSAPEFFVSLLATIRKSQELAIGNIVGSCICNIAMVLGLSALIKPITVNSSILRRELPILFAVTIGFFLICLDFKISRIEALILIVSFILFIFYCIKNARDEDKAIADADTSPSSKSRFFLYLAIGLAGLLLGSYMIVGSSIKLARHYGVSEVVIGLSAVAIGTSLPELTASLIAAARGKGDISIGNIIGSNIFNILAIAGIISLIRPVIIEPKIVLIYIPFLLLCNFALAPILRTGFRISRREGALLLASYGVYLYFIFKR